MNSWELLQHDRRPTRTRNPGLAARRWATPCMRLPTSPTMAPIPSGPTTARSCCPSACAKPSSASTLASPPPRVKTPCSRSKPGHPLAAVGQPGLPQAAGGRRAGAVPEGRRNPWATSCADRLDDATRNEFWAVNQFTIKGAHHTRRPTSSCSSTACRWCCWS
jgi:hypothetical protein